MVFNDIIPFGKFSMMNLFGVLFIRKRYEKTIRDGIRNGDARVLKSLNHEQIHMAQMKEMAYILFYVWYFIAWLVRLLTPPMKTAYIDISFEQEAYNHQWDLAYLDTRKPYA